LIDLIDMIGQSISTVAFDTDLVIKIYTIILYCILYTIREWNIASYGDNSWLHQKYWNSIIYIIERHMQML